MRTQQQRPALPGSRLGVYFIDGSARDYDDGTVVSYMYSAVRPETPLRRYYEGPSTLCRWDGTCRDRREDLARDICDDLSNSRIDVFAVFGFSRGAVLANVGAHDASSLCPDRFPAGLESRYVYGGFLDAVSYGIGRWHDSIPPWVSWLHVHRQNENGGPFWFDVQRFSGGRGANVPHVDAGASHGDMAASASAAERVMADANEKLRAQQGLDVTPFY